MFHISHEEYLDTPVEDIEWMLQLEGIETAARRAPAPAPQAPPPPPVPKIG